jgi:hypothetical protein
MNTDNPIVSQPAGAGSTATPPPAQPTPASQESWGQRVHEFEAHLPSLNEALATITSFVPGFAGYKSTEDRRIADKELRAVIGERLGKSKDRLDAVVDSLSRSGNLDGVALIDQSSRRLSRLIDRMRFADYGYAAVFDRVQIGDAELARLYQYDAALLSEFGTFEDAVSDVEMGSTDAAHLRAALVKLDALTAEFDRRFEGRKHLFDGLPAP